MTCHILGAGVVVCTSDPEEDLDEWDESWEEDPDPFLGADDDCA